MNINPDPILEFWNARAGLKAQAGSNDVIAKTLEIETLAAHLGDGLELAEFGCGNGISAVEFARRFDVRVTAFDFSPEMARQAAEHAANVGVSERVCFAVADIRDPPELMARFDVVYCERMVINLPDWPSQAAAICAMAGYLKPGGRLLMCENSQPGLDNLNALRSAVGLEMIAPPWHNTYLDDTRVAALDIPGCRLLEVVPYSATYYFLSRVVNAWLAKREGLQPAYDAPVNQLAALLPPFGDCAQGKLWIWQRDNKQG
ncbi:MAG: class I SAM-dependent methyltransferase [Rhodocyclaceae bacterium]|nr:class I SAM-dependent methyltransferase [Rhodocyclaceae bacterium]